MARLVPAIRVLIAESPASKTWTPATSANIRREDAFDVHRIRMCDGKAGPFPTIMVPASDDTVSFVRAGRAKPGGELS
jgi:hypothetical protein